MKPRSAPFLSSRVDDDVAWITLLYVPRALRRRGLGRAMVDQWRRNLPPGVREIRLLAAEIDDDSPVEFWTKMGFHAEPVIPWVDEIPDRIMCQSLESTERAGMRRA